MRQVFFLSDSNNIWSLSVYHILIINHSFSLIIKSITEKNTLKFLEDILFFSYSRLFRHVSELCLAGGTLIERSYEHKT